MKSYYTKLAVFGILLELVLIEYIFQGTAIQKGLALLKLDYLPYILAVLLSVFVKIYVGRRFDKNNFSRSLQHTFLGALAIFISGIVIGSLANFIFVTRFMSENLASDFADYCIKPLFAFSYVGIPASLVVAVVYKGLMKLIKADE